MIFIFARTLQVDYQMKNFLYTTLLCLLFAIKASAHNSIRIIPDSTNNYAKFEMSRSHASVYKISFANEKGVVMYKTAERIDSIPKIISIPWKDFSPGFYFMTAKNKRETVKLMFVKKE